MPIKEREAWEEILETLLCIQKFGLEMALRRELKEWEWIN